MSNNNNILKYTDNDDNIDDNICINCDQSLNYVNEVVECNEKHKGCEKKGCEKCMTICLYCDIDICIECIDEKSRFCKKCLTYVKEKSKQEFTIESEKYKICLNCNSILHLDYVGSSCYNNSSHKKGCEDCMEICKNCLIRTLCIDCSNKQFGLCKYCPLEKVKILNYKRGNLFEDKINNLAHCVSEDFIMGKGIAKEFKIKFQKVKELKEQKKVVGEFAYLKIDEREIYYLITKKIYNQKPTLLNLRSSLKSLKTHMKKYKLFNLSIPKIGCGLDKLYWEDLELIILYIFS